ncbi:MAG: protein disulfide oxidoreductase [Chloroflexota bacterium]|jgi:glutaredoxin-like protein|nr:thioredoxin family protein [Candidatus Sulfotelmatobacter sp.]
MSLIPDDRKEGLRNDLRERMIDSVKIVVFTQEVECRFCSDTRQLVQEIASLNDKITVEVFDFVANADRAREYKVEKIPALAIIGKKDYGVRMYGIPYGYELQTLIGGIVNVSRGTTDLSDKTKAILADVKSPVHIQVFVTLTCPHCPAAAAIAHKLAIESDMISADVIDSSEFPTLAQKYAVIGVPKVVINEKIEFVGAFNEDLFAEHVVLGSFTQ